MRKLQYLKQSKAFMRKVTQYRQFLQRNGKSHLNDSFVRTEVANIEYALPKIVSYDQACRYIRRKESVLRLLIPSNKKKWMNELRELTSRN